MMIKYLTGVGSYLFVSNETSGNKATKWRASGTEYQIWSTAAWKKV